MIKIGTLIDVERSVPDAIDEVQRMADAGFDSAWATQIFGNDALTLLAVVGSHVQDIALGTGVVPVFPRHPQMLAQQALSVQSATGDRLSLGIGLSHQVVVESMWGYSFDRPARYMREYLEALVPLLHGESVMVDGEVIKAVTVAPIDIPGTKAPDVLVAALAPVMLALAGTVTDGTVTWMTGISAIESHISPRISRAAEQAGRPTPRIVVALPVSVTSDRERVCSSIDEAFSFYPDLPSYAAILEIEGASRPSDIALVGSPEEILDSIGQLEAAGGTELVAAVSGNAEERAETFAWLGSLTATS